jgi:CDP-glucose 4,6-dehydratase
VRCLVTGASGFLGQHLVDALRMQGHEVWAIVHDVDVASTRVHTVRGAIEDLACCERAVVESRAEAVFHLAAQAIVPHARRNPIATLEANIRGTYNMLEAFRRHRQDGALMVAASSDKAYGELPAGSYSESDPLRGRGPYDVSKSCADLIAQSYAWEYGLPIGIVRAGNIYGPGDTDMTRIVPCVASAVAKRRDPVLTSDGTPVRDYLYVDDAVQAYIMLWQHMQAKSLPIPFAFNFSGGEPVSTRDLAFTAIEAAGLRPVLTPRITGTRTGEIQRQVLDSSAARGILKWFPRVKLAQGLEITIDWWRRRERDYL